MPVVARSFRQRGAVVALVACCAAVIVQPATTLGGARQTPLNANLVRNAGAEMGPHSYPEVAVKIPRWAEGKRFSVQPYGYPGQLPISESRRINGQRQFFACGWGTTDTKLSQEIALVGRRRLTDRGGLRVEFKVMIAAYGRDGDRGRGIVRYLDAQRETIAARSTRWVSTQSVRYTRRGFTMPLPRGTRYIRVQLHGVRQAGLYCNAYFDNVRLKLSRR
jgi:hypothetical protein